MGVTHETAAAGDDPIMMGLSLDDDPGAVCATAIAAAAAAAVELGGPEEGRGSISCCRRWSEMMLPAADLPLLWR